MSRNTCSVFDISGMATLFGVSIYSFMCQHSLPSLVTPIRNKSLLSQVGIASACFTVELELTPLGAEK